MSCRVNGAMLAAVFLLLFSVPAAAQPVTIERIIAKINQDIITLSELQDLVKKEGKNLLKSLKEKDARRRRRELELLALDRLVEQKLILQRAKELGARVDDKDLEKAIDTIIVRNNLTKERFKRFLKIQGISFDVFRKRMRKRMLVRQIVGLEVDSRISVNESEVKGYYDSNIKEFQKGASRKVRQIFFPIGKEDSEERKSEQKEKADDAYKKATRTGADFAKVAKSVSEGPSAKQGGDLGYVKKGEVFPEFEAAVFSQPVGIVGQPIRTRAGYHVILVTGTREGKRIPMAKIENNIKNKLFGEKRARRYREWISELKRSAFLEINYHPQGAAPKDGSVDLFFRNARDQVTFRLIGLKLVRGAGFFFREEIFWAYGTKRRKPRWESDKLKVDKERRLDADNIGTLGRMFREFVNPDPAASLFFFKNNAIWPSSFLGKVDFADMIKTYSLNPKKKYLEVLIDSKRIRLKFEIRIEKTRSIISDSQEISG